MAARVLACGGRNSAAPQLLGVRDPPDPYVGAEALRSLIAIQGAEALHGTAEEERLLPSHLLEQCMQRLRALDRDQTAERLRSHVRIGRVTDPEQLGCRRVRPPHAQDPRRHHRPVGIRMSKGPGQALVIGHVWRRGNLFAAVRAATCRLDQLLP